MTFGRRKIARRTARSAAMKNLAATIAVRMTPHMLMTGYIVSTMASNPQKLMG